MKKTLISCAALVFPLMALDPTAALAMGRHPSYPVIRTPTDPAKYVCTVQLVKSQSEQQESFPATWSQVLYSRIFTSVATASDMQGPECCGPGRLEPSHFFKAIDSTEYQLGSYIYGGDTQASPQFGVTLYKEVDNQPQQVKELKITGNGFASYHLGSQLEDDSNIGVTVNYQYYLIAMCSSVAAQ